MADLSINIGKIDGVDVQLHWSFILLLFLILLVSVYFFILWVLLFICVLVHELFHSIAAKRDKIPVKRIVLYPFGGGTIINPNDMDPKREAFISIVGPLASLGLAAIFGVASLYLTSGVVGQLVSSLFLLNLLLGVFNMLPWLPLDGGRALRSYLQRKMSYLDATKKAVLYSNIVTVLYILGSTAYALLNRSYTPSYKEFFILLNIVVAVFIYTGAESEMAYAIVRSASKGLKVRDAMSRNYIMVKSDTTLDQLGELFKPRKGKETPHTVLFTSVGQLKVLSMALLRRPPKTPGVYADDSIERFGVIIPKAKENDDLYGALEEMNEENTSILGVERRGGIIGILQRQRVEYIIGLRASAATRKGKTIK